MRIDTNFIFEIGHSLDHYDSKDKAKIALSYKRIKEYNKGIENPDEQLSKMAFVRESLSVTRFAEMATSGYTFCNLFSYDPNRQYRSTGRWHTKFWPEYRKYKNKGGMKMQMKSDIYYEGCQCFFVDIDYTEFISVKDYIAALKLKPTVVYMSYSDNVYKIDSKQKNNLKYDPQRGVKSRRFRLCYVFNEIIYGKENFKTISSAINKMVEDSTHEVVQDDCGKSMSQYFNGSVNKEVYVTGYVYEMADFNINTHTYYNESPREGQQILDMLNHDIVKSMSNCCKRHHEPSSWLIIDMERLSYDEFMHYYRNKYRYIYRKDDGTWEDGCQIVGEDFFKFYFHKNKLKDGEKRRRKLYERMCLRRLMFPDITADEVLFNAYEDLYRIIDNSKDPISIDCLARNVKSAFKLSIDEIRQRFSSNIKYLSSLKPKNGLIYDVRGAKTVSERNTKMREIRWRKYDRLYDADLSPRENAIRLGCKERTMRRFCKDRGIPTSKKVSDEFIRQMINLSLSIRGNINYFKEAKKIGLSKDRISRIKKELEFDIQRINKIVKDKKGWFIFAMNEDRSIMKDYYPIHMTNDVNIDRRLYDNNSLCELEGLLAA
jgi:hypothetical protein